MRVAVYPGSFDPVTLGHIDIIQRTAKMFDKVIIGVLRNRSKSPLFTAEERVELLKQVTADIPNVEVQSFQGLLIDFVRQNQANVIVRGLRAITDFEYELQMAQTNRVIAPEIDTIFLTTNLKYSYLSSSIVKEIAEFDGDIKEFLHPMVADQVRKKMDEMKKSIMYSRNLFVLDFARRFFVSCTQISEAYAVRTLMKFGCNWRKIGRKGKCRKDSESTS